MRRWRRREMCGGGAGHLPRKKSFFVPKMMVGCILPQFLTGRKRKASRRWFYSSMAKLQSLQKQCKIIQNFTVRPKGRRSHYLLNTPLYIPMDLQLLCLTNT